MSRAWAMVALCVAPLALTTGCGTNCNESCIRVYDANECDVQSPGVPTSETIDRCTNQCRSALSQVGPVGDYSPFAVGGASQQRITNERQAAAWMDCVSSRSCEQLNAGQCNLEL
ncbi:MAG: hypothetical protein AAGA48_07980 [Myxococcota bacterium]